jgi:hypothetical protein
LVVVVDLLDIGSLVVEDVQPFSIAQGSNHPIEFGACPALATVIVSAQCMVIRYLLAVAPALACLRCPLRR